MISRRTLLKHSGAVAVASSLPGLARNVGTARQESPADYRLEIAPATIELSPRHRIRTTVYNGAAPGPLLRFKEGRPVSIEVLNRTPYPEVVHWHGQFLPPLVDGATEEGTPAILPGATARYALTPAPAGFRWYHTHTMAMGDLSRAQYGGQHGMVIIEPRQDPAAYDQEFFLSLHDWDGRLLASDDGAMNPSYAASTINGRMLGAGEPLRVRQGQRVLLHVLNSSPTEVHWVALAGHFLQVIAMDGNAVPTARSVPMLRLAPAERVCALVEMNNPGIWVLGEVRRHVQAAGMGIVVEYADRTGQPAWQQPPDLAWNYAQFAAAAVPAEPPGEAPIPVPLTIEPRFRGHGAMEGWTINGRSYPDTQAPPLITGRRYRLQFINHSLDDHPLHLHRHSFELRSLGAPLQGDAGSAPAVAGILKDVVLVDAQTRAEVEFVANNPGDTLFHCHQQDHMDMGFMMLFKYA